MSLVGTRPPTVDEWDKYELHHRARLATKPGLTGMWQVSGRSNITDLDKCSTCKKQKDCMRYYDMNLAQTKFLSGLGIMMILFGIIIVAGRVSR